MTPIADNRLDLLRRVGLFSDCSKKELKKVASLATPVEAHAGEVLAREGKPGSELFVIAAGSARVTLRGDELAMLYPGDAFGEMALLDGGPRGATVTAATPMTLYVLGPREFATVLEDVPVIGRKVLASLARRLRDVQKLDHL